MVCGTWEAELDDQMTLPLLKAKNQQTFQKKIFCQREFKGPSEKQQRKRRKLSASLVNSCFMKQTNLYHFIGTISTCWNLLFSSCTAPYFKLFGKLMGFTRGNKTQYSYNTLENLFLFFFPPQTALEQNKTFKR